MSSSCVKTWCGFLCVVLCVCVVCCGVLLCVVVCCCVSLCVVVCRRRWVSSSLGRCVWSALCVVVVALLDDCVMAT